MRQRELQTVELDDRSGEYPTMPRPPSNRRSTAFGVVAVLLVVALGVATFASLASRRGPTVDSANAATGASAQSSTRSSGQSSASGQSQVLAPLRGAGLPEGVEVTAYAVTGPDDGWAAANVITNPVDGTADRSMVYHYSGGSWTQVGDALPLIYLGGIDMISSSEGWVLGGDNAGKGLLLHISNGAWQKMKLPAADAQGAPAVMAMRSADEGWLAMANPKGAQSGANTSLLHASGGNWSIVPCSLKFITAIAPIAGDEAWVVGWNSDGTSSLVHVQGGVATLQLSSPGNSTFSRLRLFDANDIWIEGAMHDASNTGLNDVPLMYHYDGTAWKSVDLHVPRGVQHVGMVAGNVAWGYASTTPPGASATADGQITTLYTNAGGEWKALALPYTDLQSLTVVSSSATDIWAVGLYMATTQAPNHNGAPSYASIGHNVLLHYASGEWTEYGR